eukprot:g1314.t1
MLKLLILGLTLVLAYGSTNTPTVPDPKNARAPLAADDNSFEVPVTYSGLSSSSRQPRDSKHIEKVEGGYVLHPPTGGYNSGKTAKDLEKDKEGDFTCMVCPKKKDCQSGHCFSKCVKKSGDMCKIPNELPDSSSCYIGINCGMTDGNSPEEARAEQSASSQAPTELVLQGDPEVNMVIPDAKMEKKEPPKAKPENARPPLPALEPGNGGGDLKEPCKDCDQSQSVPPAEASMLEPATPAAPPAVPAAPPAVKVVLNGQDVTPTATAPTAADPKSATNTQENVTTVHVKAADQSKGAAVDTASASDAAAASASDDDAASASDDDAASASDDDAASASDDDVASASDDDAASVSDDAATSASTDDSAQAKSRFASVLRGGKQNY